MGKFKERSGENWIGGKGVYFFLSFFFHITPYLSDISCDQSNFIFFFSWSLVSLICPQGELFYLTDFQIDKAINSKFLVVFLLEIIYEK